MTPRSDQAWPWRPPDPDDDGTPGWPPAQLPGIDPGPDPFAGNATTPFAPFAESGQDAAADQNPFAGPGQVPFGGQNAAADQDPFANPANWPSGGQPPFASQQQAFAGAPLATHGQPRRSRRGPSASIVGTLAVVGGLAVIAGAVAVVLAVVRPSQFHYGFSGPTASLPAKAIRSSGHRASEPPRAGQAGSHLPLLLVRPAPASAGGLVRDYGAEQGIFASYIARARNLYRALPELRSLVAAIYDQPYRVDQLTGRPARVVYVGLNTASPITDTPAFLRSFRAGATRMYSHLRTWHVRAGANGGAASCSEGLNRNGDTIAVCLWVTKRTAGSLQAAARNDSVWQLAAIMRRMRGDLEQRLASG